MNAPAPFNEPAKMTRGDVARLLAMMSAYDQRTIGESDVEAWHASACLANWNYDGARRAVVAHYTDTKRRIMPADVTAHLRGPGETGERICEY